MFERCAWLNEPAGWRQSGDGLEVQTDAGTDFWRETHYGFTHDSGHFFGAATDGGFTAELRVRGAYEALYDQAGLMVRLDAARWIKAGIEWSDGQALLGSVLTIDRSDWATGPFTGDPADFRIRVSVAHGVLRLQASTDGTRWPLVRLCPFPVADTYRVGPYCCSPKRGGLNVTFSEFTVSPPTAKDLHDLS